MRGFEAQRFDLVVGDHDVLVALVLIASDGVGALDRIAGRADPLPAHPERTIA